MDRVREINYYKVDEFMMEALLHDSLLLELMLKKHGYPRAEVKDGNYYDKDEDLVVDMNATVEKRLEFYELLED